MKKIMFDDRFGLTNAVLEGGKTMTRRFAEKVLVEDMDGHLCWNGQFKAPRYKVCEVVAIARSYAETMKDPNPRINRRRKELLRRSPGWTNKMFVLAELMTYRIRITAERLERLQDISDEDCLKEGVRKDGFCCTACGLCTFFDTPREAFAALIDKVSGKGTWARNPWVYVYEFELVK